MKLLISIYLQTNGYIQAEWWYVFHSAASHLLIDWN